MCRCPLSNRRRKSLDKSQSLLVVAGVIVMGRDLLPMDLCKWSSTRTHPPPPRNEKKDFWMVVKSRCGTLCLCVLALERFDWSVFVPLSLVIFRNGNYCRSLCTPTKRTLSQLQLRMVFGLYARSLHLFQDPPSNTSKGEEDSSICCYVPLRMMATTAHTHTQQNNSNHVTYP